MKFLRTALILTLVSTFLRLVNPASVFAAASEYQSCQTESSCIIGEFLYDDEYEPISNATCTLTSRYPNGSLFLNSVAMTAESDGWYSYTATTDTTEGIYRSQICCTSGSDYLCLDKTFQVKEESGTSLTAADVWSYSDRSLTSFGTLVSDIWGYSSRSLSSFGDLIANIWDYDDRTVTGGTTTATNTIINQTEVTTLTTIAQESREYLEKLVNKPIVSTFIDEGESNLQSKIENSLSLTNSLYSSSQNLKSRSELLELKWNQLTPSELESELQTINRILEGNNSSEDSVIGQTNKLKNNWNSNLTLNLSDQAQAAQSKIKNLLKDLTLFGKKSSPLSFQSALSHIQNLETLIGSSLNSADDATLYGYLKHLSELDANLNQYANDVNATLKEVNSLNPSDLNSKLTELTTNILAINKLSNPEQILIPGIKKESTSIKNKLYGLLALIDTNRLLLSKNTGSVIKNIWLEEGSVVFRTVVTNPSETISQEVPVKIYLPEEVTKEQIIKYDSELTIDYDTSQRAYFASGEITLDPEETRTFLVEVEDTWEYSEEEINTLKKQAEELTQSIRNTSFFAQATSLKSDINVGLSKILLHQKEAITPESRIRTYREARLEMIGIEDKLASLKQVVAQANSTGSIFGFIGGAQAIAVWGLIIVITGGFVFMALYMRSLRYEQFTVPAHLKLQARVQSPRSSTSHHKNPSSAHKTFRRISLLLIATSTTFGFGSLGTALATKQINNQPINLANPLSSTLKPQALGATTQREYPFEITLTPKDGQLIKVYSQPSLTSPITTVFKEAKSVKILQKIDRFYQIESQEENISWWITEDLIH